MKIEFSGKISPELKQDFRKAYYGENPVYLFLMPIFFGFAFLFLLLWQFNIDLISSLRSLEIRPVVHQYQLSVRLLLSLPMLLAFYLAFLRLPSWWAW